MVLGIFNELQKLSDKFKDYVTSDGNSYVILFLFIGLLLIFMLGWNSIHKNDK